MFYQQYTFYRKRRTETLFLTTKTWRLILNGFSAYVV